MSRTNKLNLSQLEADLQRMQAELAAAIAAKEAAAYRARLDALLSTTGLAIAGIKLGQQQQQQQQQQPQRVPARKLTRQQLILSASSTALDSTASQIRHSIATASALESPTASQIRHAILEASPELAEFTVSAPALGSWARFKAGRELAKQAVRKRT